MGRRDGFGDRYQGRRRGGINGFLKGVIVVLTLVLLLLLALWFFLQDRITYTDDGVKLELPWSDSAEETPEPDSSLTPLPLIIEDRAESEETIEGNGAEQSEPLHAILTSQTALLAGIVEEQTELAGGNAAVLSVKKDDGTLCYVSESELAISVGASGSDIEVNEAIVRLNESGLYTIAQVSCFRDDLLCRKRTDLGMLTRKSGYLWLDHASVRWVSPLQQEVRDYLTELCVELAELGFDEILLTNCGYPAHEKDKLNVVAGGSAYPEDGLLEPILADFLMQVREALTPYGVKLSVETMGSELAGETANTGLTLDNVLTYCDHFWLDAEDADAYAALVSEETEQAWSEKLVRVSSAAGAEDTAWAILS